MADAAGLGLDQNLARAGGRNVPFLLHERLAKVLDDSDVHFFTGHMKLLFSKLNRSIWFSSRLPARGLRCLLAKHVVSGLSQAFQLRCLLSNPAGRSLFIMRTGIGRSLFDQLSNVVTDKGNAIVDRSR